MAGARPGDYGLTYEDGARIPIDHPGWRMCCRFAIFRENVRLARTVRARSRDVAFVHWDCWGLIHARPIHLQNDELNGTTLRV
jgi:hypothetical protein